MNYLNIANAIFCSVEIELAKRSKKNDYSGPVKSSRFDFIIRKDDFEDLQAWYQLNPNPDHLQYRMVRKGDWCKYIRTYFEAAVDS